MEGWEIVRGVVWIRKFGGGHKRCGLEEEGGRTFQKQSMGWDSF